MKALDGYMRHNSVGGEEFLYLSEDNYFYVNDGDGMVAPATKAEIDEFELDDEFKPYILAHVLKFGI